MYCRPYNVSALITLTLLAVVPGVLRAGTLYVTEDGKAGFSTIQAAVDAAVDGDTIVIETGTYTGPGNSDIDLRGKAIMVQGADPENPEVVQATVIDCQGSEKSPHRGFTIANCNGAEIAGLTITNGLASAGGAVYCENSTVEMTSCRIIGNATLAGTGTSTSAGGPGGGICAMASALVLRACDIRGNTAGQGMDSREGRGGSGGDGGGVYAMSSVVYVLDCTVADNTAGAGGSYDFGPGRGGHGGGIYCDSLLLEDSRIIGNAAGRGGDGMQAAEGGQGGAVYCARAAIENCTIEANTAGAGGDSTNGDKGIAGKGGDGGGVFCSDSLDIAGSLVIGNRCGSDGLGLGLDLAGLNASGAGIWCYLAVIDHCTIASNAAGQAKGALDDVEALTTAGAGVFCTGQANITNSIVWGNAPDQLVGLDCEGVAYCDIEGDACPIDQGNISADPLFVRPGHWDDLNDPSAAWVAGDYDLASGSLCIGAGDPNYVPDPNATDLDGNPRLAGRAVDIGAYEFQSLVPVYRFWSSRTSKHFFTIDEAEQAQLLQQPETWVSEGIAYYAYASAGEPNLMPVYRFWSDRLSSHFWTISEAEKNGLIEEKDGVWVYEGPVFYAYPEGGQPTGAKPVYRFWSDTMSAHFYTISETEKDLLVKEHADIWSPEGIVWYAFEERSTDEKPPVSESSEYDFTCDLMAASYGLELKAYFGGQEAQIDNPSIDLASTVGRMKMAVDFSGMTTDLAEFHVESDFMQHAAVVSPSDSTGAGFPLVLSVYGFFDTLTPRGPFAIDPRTLAFPVVVGAPAPIGDETFTVVGFVVLEGQKHDVNLVLAPTGFEVEGVGIFDDSGDPGRLDVDMEGPFQWLRQGQEDLLLEATIKGQVLQVYVTSVRVRATGRWLGKGVSEEAKTEK